MLCFALLSHFSLHPMNCNPPASSVHWILQAIVLEWVSIPFSRGSSQSRDQTWVSCIAGRFSIVWATRAFWARCWLPYKEHIFKVYMTLLQCFSAVGYDLLIGCKINLMDCNQNFLKDEVELTRTERIAYNIVSWNFKKYLAFNLSLKHIDLWQCKV